MTHTACPTPEPCAWIMDPMTISNNSSCGPECVYGSWIQELFPMTHTAPGTLYVPQGPDNAAAATAGATATGDDARAAAGPPDPGPAPERAGAAAATATAPATADATADATELGACPAQPGTGGCARGGVAEGGQAGAGGQPAAPLSYTRDQVMRPTKP